MNHIGNLIYYMSLMYGHIDRLLVLALQLLATLKVWGAVSETLLRELALNVLVNFSIL